MSQQSFSPQNLSERITALEQQRQTDFQSLKQQLHDTGQSMKPANLIKSVVQDVTSSPQMKSVFAKAVVGLIIGLIAKRVLSRKNHHPVSLWKTALGIGVNLLISNRYRLLKSAGAMVASGIASQLAKKMKTRRELRERHQQDEDVTSYISAERPTVISYTD